MSFNVLHKLSCNGSNPRCVTFSQDGNLIAAGDNNGIIWIWYTNSGLLLNRIRTPRELGDRASQWPAITSLAFSPDGKTIISTTESLIDIFFWGVEQIEPIEPVAPTTLRTGFNMSNVFFTPDGKNIISAYNFGKSNIDIWDVVTGTNRTILTDRYSSLQLSSDGKTIVQAGAGLPVYTWGLPDTGENVIKLIDLEKLTDLETEAEATTIAAEDTSPVRNAAISPDKKIILSTNLKGEFKAWVDGIPKILKPERYYGNKAIFRTDGTGFVSCGDSSVTLWDAKTMAPIQTLKAPKNEYGFHTLIDIDITRDNTKIAVACSDKNVYILTDLGVNALKKSDILIDEPIDKTKRLPFLPREIIGQIAEFAVDGRSKLNPVLISKHYRGEGPFTLGKRKTRGGRKNKSKIKRKQTKKNKK